MPILATRRRLVSLGLLLLAPIGCASDAGDSGDKGPLVANAGAAGDAGAAGAGGDGGSAAGRGGGGGAAQAGRGGAGAGAANTCVGLGFPCSGSAADQVCVRNKVPVTCKCLYVEKGREWNWTCTDR